MAINTVSHSLCFDPINFFDPSDSTFDKYIFSGWSLSDVVSDFGSDCPDEKVLMKVTLKDFIEMLSKVAPFIATDFNFKPYWNFH